MADRQAVPLAEVGPRLRAGLAADAAAVAALHVASWRSAYRDELPAAFLERQSLADWTERWRARIGEPGAQLLLLEDGGLLLGFAAFGPARDADAEGGAVWELYNLHVHPERRGGGIGGRLFGAVVERGREAGRQTLTLWVVETNVRALRFYERRGLRPDGARQVHTIEPGVELREVRYGGPIA